MRRFWLIIALLIFTSDTLAEERILNYFSDIQVQSNGSMIVEESIKVRAEGKQIRRGIFRDFPTDYKDHLGNDYKVKFELLSVQRDSQTEPYHTERISNGVRIYAGSKNSFLEPGIYTYTLRYTTDRQLGFFDHHDELYWNVTGNDWAFPIDKAAARVSLPQQIPSSDIRVEAYTGPQGAKRQNYQAQVAYDGTAQFETTLALGKKEGLTIVTSWPKGHVQEPEASERIGWFLDDNRDGMIGLIGTLLLLGYYTFAWIRVGRDPQRGIIIPLYTPPKGYSPASMRFIRNMGYDKKAFSAALVNMAVSGYLTIREDADGTFTLRKTGARAKLAPGEGAIASVLFGDGTENIDLKQRNHKKLGKALKVHKRSLSRDYEKRYFLTNRGYTTPGFALSVALMIAGILSLASEEQRMVVGFMMVWLTIWSIAVFAMVKGIIESWMRVIREGKSLLKAIFSSLFALPFIAGEFFGIGVMLFEGSVSLTFTLITLLVINIYFYEWMKAPTQMGQKLIDKVDGFGLYLSVAEQEELNFKHPPEKTPELFETYLPYAIALDVEQQWGEHFSGVLSTAGTANDRRYHPSWYNGRSWDSHSFSSFASTMGSAMNSAVASSSTAPGSSSGSGGGGSSGGGGGGGGGGGW